MWKVLVFRQIVAEHFGLDEVVKECSIISIGDGVSEFVASLNAKNWFRKQCPLSNVHLIRMRLSTHPTAEMMLKQFNILLAAFQSICVERKRLSYDLEVGRFI